MKLLGAEISMLHRFIRRAEKNNDIESLSFVVELFVFWATGPKKTRGMWSLYVEYSINEDSRSLQTARLMFADRKQVPASAGGEA